MGGGSTRRGRWTIGASSAGETPSPDQQIRAQLLFDVTRERRVVRLACPSEERLEVLAHEPVEHRFGRTARHVRGGERGHGARRSSGAPRSRASGLGALHARLRELVAALDARTMRTYEASRRAVYLSVQEVIAREHGSSDTSASARRVRPTSASPSTRRGRSSMPTPRPCTSSSSRSKRMPASPRRRSPDGLACYEPSDSSTPAPRTACLCRDARPPHAQCPRPRRPRLRVRARALISLLSLGDSIDTRTASGPLVLDMRGSVSQWEREATAERTASALAHLRDTGGRLGGEALGWRRSPEVDAHGRRATSDGGRTGPFRFRPRRTPRWRTPRPRSLPERASPGIEHRALLLGPTVAALMR